MLNKGIWTKRLFGFTVIALAVTVLVILVISIFGDKLFSIAGIYGKEQTIESSMLKATVDTSFPRVIQYKWIANDAVLYGQEDDLTQMVINGSSYSPKVSFTKTKDTAKYKLTFPEINVEIRMNLKVVDNVLQLNFTDIKEKGSVKVYTIEFPNHSLVSVRTTQPGAKESSAHMKLVVWEDSSDEEFSDLSQKEPNRDPVNRTYVILNTDQLAATIDSNTIEEFDRYKYQTVNMGSYKKCGLWSNAWTYREIETEITELPWAKIIITADENEDGIVDWQDGAIGYRKNMTEPLGADVLRNSISHSSNSVRDIIQWPFLRVLDNIKKLYLYLDGFGQVFQYNGIFRGNAVVDWDQNYEEKLGGLAELNILVDNALKYNCKIGVYLNQTEVYPEELSYDKKRITSDFGWAVFDESRKIDRKYDLTTTDRPLSYRLDQLKTNIPNLYHVFFDAYYDGFGWESWKLANTVKSKGLAFQSEFLGFERNQIWSSSRNIDSKIMRFIKNHVYESFTEHPLLKGPRSNSFMQDVYGDGHAYNLNYVVESFFKRNLPTKYMQQSPIRKWTDTRVDFENKSYVAKEADSVNLYSKDGNMIASGVYSSDPDVVFDKVFIPWDSNNETKIYHWNSKGGASEWKLPDSWTGVKTVKLYELTDLGKIFVSDIPVSGQSVTVNAEANKPFVIYKTAQSNPEMVWGEGSPVKDPGFDSHSFTIWSKSSTYKDTGHITIKNNDLGQTYLDINGNNGADAIVSQKISGLKGGKTYVASVWVNTTRGRKAILGVKDYGGPDVENWVTKTDVTCYWRESDKRGTTYQRMKVYFDVSAGHSEATLYLEAEPGTSDSRVMFDDVRIVETKRTPQGSHYFFEDFENVDEEWGPFVAGGYQDGPCRTHLSRFREGYTTDTINGNVSLKTKNEPITGEEIYRTVPSKLRLSPNTTYTLSFKYNADIDQQYRVAVRTIDGGKDQEIFQEALGNKNTTFSRTFTTGSYDDYYIAIFKTRSGDGFLILDDFTIDLGAVTITEDNDNLARNKQVTSSCDENNAWKAVDGMAYSRWVSKSGDPQWIYVDLGADYNVNSVRLVSEAASGNRVYKVQVSNDASKWTDVYSTAEGDGGIDDISFASVNARYVRLYGHEEGSEKGYPIWEFEVYGDKPAS